MKPIADLLLLSAIVTAHFLALGEEEQNISDMLETKEELPVKRYGFLYCFWIFPSNGVYHCWNKLHSINALFHHFLLQLVIDSPPKNEDEAVLMMDYFLKYGLNPTSIYTVCLNKLVCLFDRLINNFIHTKKKRKKKKKENTLFIFLINLFFKKNLELYLTLLTYKPRSRCALLDTWCRGEGMDTPRRRTERTRRVHGERFFFDICSFVCLFVYKFIWIYNEYRKIKCNIFL